MPSYHVKFVEGQSVGAGEAFAFTGLRHWLTVAAASRADAYIVAYRELRSRGEVTVLAYRAGDERPLTFTQQEQEAVRRAGVPMTAGYPRGVGVQIEVIEAESPPPRMGLRLDGLPDLLLSSWETDVAGQWSIFYDAEIDGTQASFCVSEYEGSGFVGQARERFAESGAVGQFDLDQARRAAADRVVVRQVTRALEYARLHPRSR